MGRGTEANPQNTSPNLIEHPFSITKTKDPRIHLPKCNLTYYQYLHLLQLFPVPQHAEPTASKGGKKTLTEVFYGKFENNVNALVCLYKKQKDGLITDQGYIIHFDQGGVGYRLFLRTHINYWANNLAISESYLQYYGSQGNQTNIVEFELEPLGQVILSLGENDTAQDYLQNIASTLYPQHTETV